MKRAELSELTKLLADGTITGSESQRLADFLLQIAQAQPVGWRYWKYHEGLAFPKLALEKRVESDEPLYTLPLED